MDVDHPYKGWMENRQDRRVCEETRVATASPEAGTLLAAPYVSLAGTAKRTGAFLVE